MATVEVKGALKLRNGLGQFIKKLGDPTKLHERIMLRGFEWIQDNWPTTPANSELTKRVKGSATVLVDHGDLYRSATTPRGSSSVSEFTKEHARIGLNHPAANALNFGAIITPKTASYLAVPLDREAQRAGSPRNFPKELKPIPTKAKDGYVLVEVQVKKSKGRGKPTEAGRKLGRARYWLTKKIIIPGRKFMPDENDMREIALEETQLYYDDELRKAVNG